MARTVWQMTGYSPTIKLLATCSGGKITSSSSIFLVILGLSCCSTSYPGDWIPQGMNRWIEISCRSISERSESARPG